MCVCVCVAVVVCVFWWIDTHYCWASGWTKDLVLKNVINWIHHNITRLKTIRNVTLCGFKDKLAFLQHFYTRASIPRADPRMENPAWCQTLRRQRALQFCNADNRGQWLISHARLKNDSGLTVTIADAHFQGNCLCASVHSRACVSRWLKMILALNFSFFS